MINKVEKFEIVGDKDELLNILKDLKEAGIVHLEEYPIRYEYASVEIPNEQLYRKARNYLNDIEHILGEFPYEKHFVEINEDDLNYLKTILDRAREISAKENELKSKLEILLPYRKMLAKISGDEEPSTMVLVQVSERKKAERVLKEVLESYPLTRYRFVEYDTGRLVLAIYSGKSVAKDIEDIFRKHGFAIYTLPEKYRNMSYKQAYTRILEDVSDLQKQLEELQVSKEDLRKEAEKRIAFLKMSILDRFEDINVVRKFASYTKYAFFLRGWILEKDKFRLVELLQRYKGKYFLKFEKPTVKEYEKAPVSLSNAKLWKPFETLLSFYGMPKYGTIDPTFFLWLFFPIYFGFMLGDVGFGLLMLVGLLFLKWKFESSNVVKDIVNVYMWCVFFTILFGFLYGEFFGEVFAKAGILKPIVHRIHDVNLILALGIGAGALQVFLGYILGIWKGIRLKDRHHALFDFFNLLGVYSLFLFGLHFLEIVKFPPIVANILIALFVLSAIAVTKLHGIVAPMELVSSVGHIISFARLSAVAIASAILANLPEMFFHMLGGQVFVGIFVGLLAYMLAFILGVMDPTIQGVRLQFVEFFIKFFESTDRTFKPLQKGGLNYVA